MTQEKNKSTLVMGAAIGYSEKQITPFLTSLGRGGYRGDIALIVNPVFAKQTQQSSIFEKVHFVEAPQWTPKWRPLYKRRIYNAIFWQPTQVLGWLALQPLIAAPRLRAAWARRVFHPQLSRFFHYQDFLRAHHYDRVLIADIRDVLFQSNPFEQLPVQGLAVSMETPKYTIATQYWNALWVRTAYGADGLQQIGGKPVSCSGVTYGDFSSITRYLDLMVDELLKLPLRAVIQAGDQGMHNFLLWTGRLGSVVRLENFGSAVATLNEISGQGMRLSPDGHLLNADGSLVSIIHQYDRSPGLAPALLYLLAY